MVNIISYNVEYGNNLNEIYNWIKSLEKQPQIICFQEFPEDKIDELRNNKIFQNQTLCFAKGLTSRGKFFGELTIIDNTRLKIVSNNFIDFGVDSLESKFKRKKIKRSAIITILKNRENKFSITNVHLTPLSLNSRRKKQLKEVVGNINLNNSIIIGDFNYSSLLTRGGLVVLMKEHSYYLAGEKIITNKYKHKIPQQLDYVFYKNVEVKNVEVLELPYSDHFPVLADLDI